jgi:UDP-N-acetylglucosamine--N-acetylmuramyl-(pentapeptide) pyrophosphoryl-undecaprenol N-acetylglucosamine transferase
VIGVGGYASGPVVLMARLAGVPTAICEQNSIPGLTNKILGRIARAVFLSFEESRRFFASKKVVMSGNPVRRALVAELARGGAADAGAPAADAAGSTTREVRVLISGGSQGRRGCQRARLAGADLAREGRPRPCRSRPPTRPAEKTSRRRARYAAAASVNAECHAFIRDMAAAYRRADLVLGRASATTVAELAIAGKPAIFIPYPFAADNHQELNAREMAEAGAALMFRQADLTADKLAAALRPLLADPARRARDGRRDGGAREARRRRRGRRLVRGAAPPLTPRPHPWSDLLVHGIHALGIRPSYWSWSLQSRLAVEHFVEDSCVEDAFDPTLQVARLAEFLCRR